MGEEKHDQRGESYLPERQPYLEGGDQSSSVSLEKDAAAAIVPDYALDLDKAVERRVLRKIDLFLIPLMWIGYGLVYYDKVGLSYTGPKQKAC